MKKIVFFIFLILVLSIVSGCTISGDVTEINSFPETKVTIFKSPTCGCCINYASYLKKNDFDVKIIDTNNMLSIRNEYGVPKNMESCHTTVIGDYFVEGHVPIEAINHLLGERPSIMGIALPGMPSASPGMPGAKLGPFNIYGISSDRQSSLFITV